MIACVIGCVIALAALLQLAGDAAVPVARSRPFPSRARGRSRRALASVALCAALAHAVLQISAVSTRQVIELAKILYTQHDPAKDKPIELELSWVCDASNRMHQLVPPDLKVCHSDETARDGVAC